MSSASEEWSTPPQLFAEIAHRWGPFDLDAAASHSNAKCERYYTAESNGLLQPWFGNTFVNPPYGKTIGQWIEKAVNESMRGVTSVMLIPARISTVWFRELFEHSDEVVALSGNVTFGAAKDPAPFGSVVAVLRPRPSIWTQAGGVRYSMPARHGTRPRMFPLKSGTSTPIGGRQMH